MTKTLLTAVLLAAPGLALAQTTPNNSRVQPIPSQTNLQDQANQSMQPPNARSTDRGTGLGQADKIPTPTFGNSMSGTPAARTVPHSDPAR